MKIGEHIIFSQKETIFENLYKKLQPGLYAYSRKFVDNPEIARDLVQDAFIKLWENVDILTVEVSTAAYLRKTVHNLCLLYLRDRRIRQRYESYTTLKLKEAELNFFSSEYGVYTSVFLKDMDDIINKCIEKLPPQSRRIFEMSRFECLPHAEIARRLNISVRTVENHIFRSLPVLKVALQDYLALVLIILILSSHCK